MTAPDSPKTTSETSRYSERVDRFSEQAEALGKRSNLLSNFRGLTFGGLVISALFWLLGDSSLVAGAASVGFSIAFAILVVAHGRVLAARDTSLRWVSVNRDAHARCTDAWRELPNDGARFQNPLHPFADDLDLFGTGSLFQRLCVAQTSFGQQRLSALLMNRASLEEILARQEALRELAPLLDVRQELEALALAVVEPLTPYQAGRQRRTQQWLDPEPLLSWAEGKPVLLPNRLLVVVAYVAPPLTLGWIVVCFALGFHPVYFIGALIAQALILLTARIPVARVFAAVSTTQGEFLRFGPMLRLLESLPAKSPALVELQKAVRSTDERPPSQAMREFERVVSWFEFRHNGLVYPFINGLLLWDIHCVLLLERWQQRSGQGLRKWFQALGELEALSSLAAFAEDNANFAWPTIRPGEACFQAEALGHPLIREEQRVPNDVRIDGPGHALLVTGSNMSGKSTLLRAMGVNAVLALSGAPVCARALVISPMAIRTSMRISDSLHQGVSHFYAEVKSLKSVLDATQGPVPVFFLLDEILHGTNSRERQIGARWVLAQLLERGGMGAVSTHDEGLCELPAPLMEKVRQVHLRETVVDDEMTFDYLLREGPVTSGNALRLMRSAGIAVPLE